MSDRYATSNIIYQMCKLSTSREKNEFITWAEDFEYNKLGIPKPDLVIYLDMPIDISQKLMTSRYAGDETKKDIHEKNTEFLNNCYSAAQYASEKCGWKVVKCAENGLPLSVEEIHQKIIKIVKESVL